MTEYRALRIAREMAARNEGRYFKDWIKRQAQKAGQSMTTLTDRERELVEAARRVSKELFEERGYIPTRLVDALRAYDPPKRKYPVKEWDELTEVQRLAIAGARNAIDNRQFWAAIREALLHGGDMNHRLSKARKRYDRRQ